MDIKAIETEYKGYRFRSRLEARWAIFFDACNMEWEYEPEGFYFEDGVQYLPDFLVHDVIVPNYEYNTKFYKEKVKEWKDKWGEETWRYKAKQEYQENIINKLSFIKKDVYFEIKPNKELSPKEEDKIMHLVAAKKPLVVLSDIPSVPDMYTPKYLREYELEHWSPHRPILNTITLEGTRNQSGKLCGCHINLVALRNEKGKNKLGLTKNSDRLTYDMRNSPRVGDKGFISNNLKLARQARFEFGETPERVKKTMRAFYSHLE